MPSAFERGLNRGYALIGISLTILLETQERYDDALPMIRRAKQGGVHDTNGSITKWVEEHQAKVTMRENRSATQA